MPTIELFESDDGGDDYGEDHILPEWVREWVDNNISSALDDSTIPSDSFEWMINYEDGVRRQL